MAIVTRGLTKRYGAADRRRRASTSTCPRGQVYGFLGPNGSGKTTTLRMLVGLIRPNAGDIEVLGQPWSWRDRRRMFRIGALIETPAFYPYLSGRDNLRVFGATGRAHARGRAWTRCWRRSVCTTGQGTRSGPTPWACSSDWASRSRCCPIRTCCCSTSRPTASIRRASWPCASCCATSRTGARPCSCPATSCPRSSSSRTSWASSTAAGWCARGRSTSCWPAAPRSGCWSAPTRCAQAVAALAALGIPVEPTPSADAAGGLASRSGYPASRRRSVNRLLAERGIFASAIDATSDLESVFLSLTAGAGMDVDGATPAGPPAGWGTPGGAPMIAPRRRGAAQAPPTLGQLRGPGRAASVLMALVYLLIGADQLAAATASGPGSSSGSRAPTRSSTSSCSASAACWPSRMRPRSVAPTGTGACCGSSWHAARVARATSSPSALGHRHRAAPSGVLIAYAAGIVADDRSAHRSPGIARATRSPAGRRHAGQVAGLGTFVLLQRAAIGFAVAMLMRSQVAGVVVGIVLYLGEGDPVDHPGGHQPAQRRPVRARRPRTRSGSSSCPSASATASCRAAAPVDRRRRRARCCCSPWRSGTAVAVTAVYLVVALGVAMLATERAEIA